MSIVIQPMGNFEVGDVLKGTLIAYDDAGQPLGWEGYGIWSRIQVQRAGARELAATVGITMEQATALIRQALAAARRAAAAAGPRPTAPPPAGDLPVILLDGYVRDWIDSSWAVMMPKGGRDPDFYRLGDVVVELGQNHHGKRTKVLYADGLAGRLDRLANYMRPGRKTPVAAHPPANMVAEMLALPSPDLPGLRRIAATPVLSATGEVLAHSGYYRALELFLDLGGVVVPPVPPQPSRQDVAEAKRWLLQELLPNFPFRSPPDLANYVGALLTQPMRELIDGPTPLHGLDAPAPGTGKGLLADLVAILTIGRFPQLMAPSGNEEEMRKRILSTLLTLPSVVVIDNVSRKLDSPALSAVLTAREWQDRELGYSRNVSAPVTTSWLCTGNNLSFSVELARRAVMTRIDARVEEPWMRTGWNHPLPEWALTHRGQLLWALLVLCRHWWASGKPQGTVEMGSFVSWSRTIGGVLDAAGIKGFLGNLHDTYNSVWGETSAWAPFLEVWWEKHQSIAVGAGTLFDLAKEKELLSDLRANHRDGGARVILGKELMRLRDRRITDYALRAGGTVHGGGTAFWLEKIDDKDFSNGDGKTSSPTSPTSPPQSNGISDEGGDDGPQNGNVGDDYPHQHPQNGDVGGDGRGSGDDASSPLPKYESGVRPTGARYGGDVGDDEMTPHGNSLDDALFFVRPEPGRRCSCPFDNSYPPLPPEGLPQCPHCNSNAFWCRECGGCKVCVIHLRA